jgi:hypothetical protein
MDIGSSIRLLEDVASEILEVRRQWTDIFEVSLGGEGTFQSRILYPGHTLVAHTCNPSYLGG